MEPPGVVALPSTPEAPGLARRHLERLGASWSPDLLEITLLVVSEAVTNAVRYGAGEVRLRVEQDGGTLRIEVSDANPEPPRRRPPPLDGLDEGGRGLPLLDALTRSWGTDRRPDAPGKTVWMEIPCS